MKVQDELPKINIPEAVGASTLTVGDRFSHEDRWGQYVVLHLSTERSMTCLGLHTQEIVWIPQDDQKVIVLGRAEVTLTVKEEGGKQETPPIPIYQMPGLGV